MIPGTFFCTVKTPYGLHSYLSICKRMTQHRNKTTEPAKMLAMNNCVHFKTRSQKTEGLCAGDLQKKPVVAPISMVGKSPSASFPPKRLPTCLFSLRLEAALVVDKVFQMPDSGEPPRFMIRPPTISMSRALCVKSTSGKPNRRG